VITLSCSYSIFIACTCIFYFHCTCYSSLTLFILIDFSLPIKKAIEHLNSYLEEYRGEVLEPLIENLASFFDLSWLFAFFFLIVVFSYLISITPIHPPLGVLSIGIRALNSCFYFGQLREILLLITLSFASFACFYTSIHGRRNQDSTQIWWPKHSYTES